MTNPPWQRLSRDDLVTIIGDYYKFLTKFYMPESAIKFPPSGGWPNISQATAKDFRRSSAVIDLLKHLPYIDEHDARQMITNIHYKCDVVDYSVYSSQQWAEDEQMGAMSVQELVEEFDERKAENPENESEDDDEEDEYLWYRDSSRDQSADSEENWFDGDDSEDIKMENMIVLADGYESGGRAIILDVFKGNIYEDMLECNLSSEKPIEDYFDDLRERFEKLVMVPVPGDGKIEGRLYGDIDDIEEDGDGGGDEGSEKQSPAHQFREIYRSFGWPGEGYDKEGAVAAVKAHAQRQYDAM